MFKVRWDTSLLRNYVMSTGKHSCLLRRSLLLPSPGTLSSIFLDYFILNEYSDCRCYTCWNFLKSVISRNNCPTWHLHISLYKQSCRHNMSCGRTLMKLRVRIYLSQCGIWTHTQITKHFTLLAVCNTLRRSCPLFIDLQPEQGFPDSNHTRFIARRTLGSGRRHQVFLQINTKARNDTSHNNVILVAMSVRRPNIRILFVFVNVCLAKYYTAKTVRMIFSSLKRCWGKDLESHTKPHAGQSIFRRRSESKLWGRSILINFKWN
jgi:hypothetical protein